MAFELLCKQSGGTDQRFAVGNEPLMVGSLSSNQVAIMAAGMEPIHALIEVDAEGVMRVTDLGTLRGVKINGQPIHVEGRLKLGDLLDIGGTLFEVMTTAEAAPAVVEKSKRQTLPAQGKEKRGLSGLPIRLFRPEGSATGDDLFLEVVAYWGNTVLNVDHFRPGTKGLDQVTIGDPTKANFIAGGHELFKTAVLAEVREGRSALHMRRGMRAKVRQAGKTKKVQGKQLVNLGLKDYAHVQYGSVRYFLHYTRHPAVTLPPPPPRSAFHTGLSWTMAGLYFALIAIALLMKPEATTLWDTHVEEPILILPPLEQTITFEKDEPKKVDLTKVKTAKPLVRITPEKVQAKQPVVPPKVETKTVKPEKVKVQVVKEALPQKTISAKAQTVNRPQNAVKKPAVALNPKTPSFAGSTPTVGRRNPNDQRGEQGGPQNTLTKNGSPIRGTGRPNLGVEGGQSANQGMINLHKLKSTGLTSISNNIGGIPTKFKPGGGMGKPGGNSLSSHGMGGIDQGKSLQMRGTGGDGFGTQPGGFLGGQNGSAGSLEGLRAGKSQASVAIYDPVSGVPADMSSDILFVIRKNLNKIRHCYNTTLQYNPNVTGKLTAAFTIGPDGRVTVSSIRDGSITDMKMRSCVSGVIKRWTFPRPPAGLAPVNVTYPFVFHSA